MRTCTNRQNLQNQRKTTRKTSSIYKGVNWQKHAKKWEACLRYDYGRIHLGYYDNEIDAAKAYDNKARELFGEFALPNLERFGGPRMSPRSVLFRPALLFE